MFTAESLTPMAAAKSPEEAAQMIKGAIAVGLAEIIAKAIDDAVGDAKTLAPASAVTTGWENFIGGASIALNWDRSIGSIPGQITAFAKRQAQIDPPSGLVGALGVGVSVGISITGSF